MTIFFILDYGSKYGLGHLSRCSNLALHLQKKGLNVGLITSKTKLSEYEIKTVNRFLIPFRKNIYKVERLETTDLNEVSQNAYFINKLSKENIFLIDHYYLTKNFVIKLFNYKKLIHFKDDINDKQIIDISRNSNKEIYLLPEEIIRNNYLLSKKNIYFGVDLFPLFPPKISLKKPSLYLNFDINIFLIPGAAGLNHTITIIKRLKNIFKNEKINFVVPNFKGHDDLIISKIDGQNGLQNYIYYSDLVISAAGNTMLEAIYLKTNVAIFCTNQNQKTLINYYLNKGKIKYIDNANNITKDFIVKNLKIDKFKSRDYLDVEFSYDRLIDIISNN